MKNLIGQTAAETRANILAYAVSHHMEVLDDRQYDGSLESALNMPQTLAWIMSVSNGSQTVSINIMCDGRIRREVR